jgi:hypothetical protein
MGGNGSNWWRWMLVPLGSIVLSLLYFLVWMPVKAEPGQLALFERGIGSPLLKLLNGYLGSFFNLRYLGNTAIWALPVLIALSLRWRSLAPSQRGLVIFLSMAVLIIGGAGGFNYRYAMTLLPPLIGLVMVTFARRMGAEGVDARARNTVMITLVLATVLNTKLSMDLSERMALEDPVDRQRLEDDAPFYTKFNTGPEDLDAWLSNAGVGPEERVLVNNLPAYYYTTARPGLYYWCGADQYFGPRGEEPIFRGRTDDEVIAHLVNDLDTRYILSDLNLSRYDLRFERFLNERCTLLAQDDKGHTLHALPDTFGR